MKTRIISAIVALAIFVPIIILGGRYFAVAMGVLGLLAYREILNLKENAREIPLFIKFVGMVLMLLLIFSECEGFNIINGLSYKGLGVLLLTLFIPTLFYKSNVYTTREAFYLTGVVLLLGLVFNGFILVRALSIYRLVYLFLICALTDAFAMFTGMLIGKHKLCPTISPKKTIEGSLGGTIIGSTVGIIFYLNLVGDFSYKLILFTLLLSIIGQLGDLFFSKIKRENGIKDFSKIMPGHGGVLDRLDSLCFVVLAYLVVISYF